MTRRLALALLVWATVASASPQRIISAAPSITEMLYAVGAGPRVVAVTSFCHYPPEVRTKPQIGTYLEPNMEAILALRPDLVVILREHGELRDQLERLGLNVMTVQHNDVAGIEATLRELGARVGDAAAGEREAQKVRDGLADVRRRAASLPRRKTMFVIGRTPGTVQDLMVVGKGPFLNELIEAAGGANMFAGAMGFYPSIPREEIYARKPEVILDMGEMAVTDGVTEADKRAVVELWRKAFPRLPAVTEKRVYAVAKDYFVVPGPRVVEAAQDLLRMIHPEAH
ncbi:MAG: ABC transporter substrate-binding protein [Bryobacterales bacterium]|nr:ABC transporter substrate-binding protein [Bryobacterales bacterium]